MIARGDRLEVGASAKGSVVAEEDPDIRFRVFIKVPERVCECLRGVAIDCVADFGSA
jgi:hypothetical protein